MNLRWRLLCDNFYMYIHIYIYIDIYIYIYVGVCPVVLTSSFGCCWMFGYTPVCRLIFLMSFGSKLSLTSSVCWPWTVVCSLVRLIPVWVQLIILVPM